MRDWFIGGGVGCRLVTGFLCINKKWGFQRCIFLWPKSRDLWYPIRGSYRMYKIKKIGAMGSSADIYRKCIFLGTVSRA